MATVEVEHDHLQALLARLGVGIIVTDAEGFVEHLSPFAERLTGWSAEEAAGQRVEKVLRLVSGGGEATDGATSAARPGAATAAGGVEESFLISRRGHRFPVEHSIAPTRDEQGRIRKITIAFHDITQRNYAALQLARQTTHDPLTGLLNRQAFTGAVERALEKSQEQGLPCTLCHVDIDRFNLIINTCGHDAGNDLLQWVAALLREEARENDMLARFGGDVFAILHVGSTLEDARECADSLLRRLTEFQFSWGDRTFPIGACIGLVPVASGGHAVAEIMGAADYACSLAKKDGRNHIHICHLEDEELARRQQELEWIARIKKHLLEGGVTLFAQPIVPLTHPDADGLSFEVLLRMTGEDGTLRSAGRVIQAAERFGLMGAIDRWVIRTTLRSLRALPAEVRRRVRLCSVNLSGVSLHDPSVLEFIHEQLAHFRVAPQQICFELTETAAVENLRQASWLMGELMSIGCRIALDDFGSGLASYSHLKDLPVSFLKIAGDFIENIGQSMLDRAMVESITQIARVLGVDTIAEAVGSEHTLETVRAIGVDWAQGNFLAPPRPFAEVCRLG